MGIIVISGKASQFVSGFSCARLIGTLSRIELLFGLHRGYGFIFPVKIPKNI
jgi:hypothetical protein